jgi:hypothetical protein
MVTLSTCPFYMRFFMRLLWMVLLLIFPGQKRILMMTWMAMKALFPAL